jgi:hypothetical protein
MQAANVAFSKIIKLGNRLREFNFRKLPASENFAVDVADDKGKRILFRLHKNFEGSWTIQGENLPAWLEFSQSLLGETIEKEITI